jgi:hypothetical protein
MSTDKERRRRRRDSTERDYTLATSVIVTSADGTTKRQDALTPSQMARVVRGGQSAARTWHEPHGWHGGGSDFKT